MARQLGGRTVEEWQAEMSAREFEEWCIFEVIEPGDPLRGDYQAAVIAYTIAAVNQTKKGRRPKLQDFLLRFNKQEEEVKKSPQNLKTKLNFWRVSYTAARKKAQKKQNKKKRDKRRKS